MSKLIVIYICPKDSNNILFGSLGPNYRNRSVIKMLFSRSETLDFIARHSFKKLEILKLHSNLVELNKVFASFFAFLHLKKAGIIKLRTKIFSFVSDFLDKFSNTGRVCTISSRLMCTYPKGRKAFFLLIFETF